MMNNEEKEIKPKLGVVTKEEWKDFLTLREEAKLAENLNKIEASNNDEPMFGNH